jgi:hypothetical protein
MKQFHVAIAAEAFAAGLFAQAGCDVSVQYGANQPHYDLMVTRDCHSLMVSVKGSQDGGWGLIQNYKKPDRTYHEAINHWQSVQLVGVVFCFVQFRGVPLGDCPRVYLASVQEIAELMRNSRNGNGDTILWERHTHQRGIANDVTDEIPAEWRFSLSRVACFL